VTSPHAYNSAIIAKEHKSNAISLHDVQTTTIISIDRPKGQAYPNENAF